MLGSGATAALRGVLRSGRLGRLLFSYFAFHVAEFGSWLAILLYAYDTTGPASVGVIALIQLVPAALAAAPAATLGDRFPRHRVLTLGYVFQAGAMAATGLAMLLSAPVAVIYLAATIAATALVITRPTFSALLPSMSRTPDELTAANGAVGIVEGLGGLLGPLIAAVVVAGSSVGVAFLLAGGALIGGAVATAGLRPQRQPSAPGPTAADDAPDASPDVSFITGVRAVIHDPDARLIVGLLTARMVVAGAADVLLVLLALDLLDMGTSGAGLLNAALGGGTILGGALAFALVGRERLASVALLGSLAWAVAVAAVGLSGVAVLAPGLLVLGCAGLTILEVSSRTILQRSVRDDVLARVFGIQEGLGMAGLAIGSVAVAVLVAAVGLVPTVVIAGAFMPLVVGLGWRRLVAIDRRARPPIQVLRLLRRTSLFAPLPPPQLEAVARRGAWMTVEAGTPIIREGDIGDRYYILDAGSVEVTQGGALLRTMGPGSSFGEVALLLDIPRTASVTAVEPSVLFAIDRASFLVAMTGRPDALATARREAFDHVTRPR
jgi:MFS family permease